MKRGPAGLPQEKGRLDEEAVKPEVEGDARAKAALSDATVAKSVVQPAHPSTSSAITRTGAQKHGRAQTNEGAEATTSERQGSHKSVRRSEEGADRLSQKGPLVVEVLQACSAGQCCARQRLDIPEKQLAEGFAVLSQHGQHMQDVEPMRAHVPLLLLIQPELLHGSGHG